jgi:hypothetical protein
MGVPLTNVAEDTTGPILDLKKLFGIVADSADEELRRSPRIARRCHRIGHIDDAPLPVDEADEQATAFSATALTELELHRAEGPRTHPRGPADRALRIDNCHRPDLDPLAV